MARPLTALLPSVVQNRITAFWFKGKELALAFGLTLAFSRLGSVLNFFLTQKFEEKHGMQWTLWGGRWLIKKGHGVNTPGEKVELTAFPRDPYQVPFCACWALCPPLSSVRWTRSA